MEIMKDDGRKGKLDDESFRKAVSDYRERIYLMLLKYVRNREDAKDLTQDAFVRAYSSRNSFRGESSLYTWIHRIAVNLAINFKTRNRISSHSSLEDSPPIAGSDDPSSGLMTKELSGRIDKAVKNLPGRQRMVFVLRFYDEKPYSEIAEDLGITEGGAKANYHQAIRKLKNELSSYLKSVEE